MCRHTLAPRLAKLSHIMWLLIQLNYSTLPVPLLLMAFYIRREGDILGYEQKSMKHITNNIVYEKVGGIQDLTAIEVYRTITFFLLIRPCYPAFYITITVKSYTHMTQQRMILSTKAECTLASCRMSLTIHRSGTSIWKHNTFRLAKSAWNDPKEVQHTI